MRALEAEMKTALVYRAARKSRGYAGFDFRIKDINIGKLVDFIPALDTVVPMLRSFKGLVNFDVAAEAVLDFTEICHPYQRRQSCADGWGNLCGNIQNVDVQE